MRIDPASSRPLHLAPNLTPLVDVVIVVLIFLMLAGSFGGATHFLESKFVPTGKLKRVTDSAPQTLTIDLFIADASDGIGFTVRGVGVSATSDLGLLTDRLRTKAADFADAGLAPGDVRVVLHPRGNVRYAHLTSVYEAAARAHFSKIAFATSQ